MTHTASIRLRSQPAQFLALWTVANLLGGFLVGFLESYVQFFPTIFLTGALLGLLQWGLLRRESGGFRWWALASAIGWPIGVLLASSGSNLYQPLIDALVSPSPWYSFWRSLLTGPFWISGMAIAQALIFSSPGRSAGVSWLLISLLGGAVYLSVGTVLSTVFSPTSFSPTSLGEGTASGLAWAAYGIVTGIGLLSLSHSLESR